MLYTLTTGEVLRTVKEVLEVQRQLGTDERGEVYAYMDDVAVTEVARDSARLTQLLERDLHMVEGEHSELGMKMSRRPWKTCCMMMAGGKGGRQQRREIAARSSQGKGFLGESKEMGMEVTRMYIHLGTLVYRTGREEHETRRRYKLAVRRLGNLRRGVLRGTTLRRKIRA